MDSVITLLRPCFFAAASLLLCAPVRAQLALPGATAPAPLGSVVAPEKRQAKPRPRPPAAPPASPAETNLAGKTVFLNGGKSEMAFVAHDKTVDLARLLLTGTKISDHRDECQVDVAGMPLPLKPLGKAAGLSRFALPVPVCPLTFDVLNGAVFVSSEEPVCTFTEADCEASPGGLWGVPPGDIGPDQVKTIERERTQADRSLRAAYHGLVGSTKDRAAIRGFASEQAGFSSRREEQCRDYIGESRHGFCASRLTQARATALETALAGVKIEKDARKKRAGAK